MKITKIVLSADRTEHAVFLEDGSKLERVQSIACESSADNAGIVYATIKVMVFNTGSSEYIDTFVADLKNSI